MQTSHEIPQPGPILAAWMRNLEGLTKSLQDSTSPPKAPLPSAESVAAFVENTCSEEENQQVIAAVIYDVGIRMQLLNSLDLKSDASTAPSNELASRLKEIHRKAFKSVSDLEHPRETSSDTAIETLVANEVDTNSSQAASTRRLSTPFLAIATIAAAITCIFLAWQAFNNRDLPKLVEENSPSNKVDANRNLDKAREENTEADPGFREIPEPVLANQDPGTPEPNDSLRGSTPPSSEKLLAENDRPVAPQITKALEPSVADLQPAAVTWTQITGALVQQQETGYDSWKMLQANSPEKLTDAVLTLPTSFAKGEIGEIGNVVLAEATHACFKILDADRRRLSAQLFSGQFALTDVRAETELRLVDINGVTTSTLWLPAAARAVVQRVSNQTHVAVFEGEARLDDALLPAGQLVQLSPNEDIVVVRRMTQPKWIQRLPRSAELSREVLSQFNGGSLTGSIDQELNRMLANGSTNTPRGLALFQTLCRWRVSLAVEDIDAVQLHTAWPVRFAAFEAIFSSDQTQWLIARRDLVGSLPNPARTLLRKWLSATNRREATRAEIAEWLDLLTNSESQVAAFGDYLLRKRFGPGPQFDPSASQAARRRLRQAWANFIVAGRRTP